MSQTDPKRSALQVAKMRAAHQLFDHPLIFADPLALPILGPHGHTLPDEAERHAHPILKALRASIVIRSRFTEDEWLQSGLDQLVILGAGLDTSAYRAAPDTRTFEVDLPSTQTWKRSLLAEANIQPPAFLTFTPVDFETDSLPEQLRRSGFDPARPAFISWLGVSMYIDEPAVNAILTFAASLAPGSILVFDYAVHPSLLTEREQASQNFLADRTSRHGEPWKTFFIPTQLATTLTSLGFRHLDDFGPDRLNTRYTGNRTDGLRKSGTSRLMRAEV